MTLQHLYHILIATGSLKKEVLTNFLADVDMKNKPFFPPLGDSLLDFLDMEKTDSGGIRNP
jgi:hypothetical protein